MIMIMIMIIQPVWKRDNIEDWDVATISSFSLSQVSNCAVLHDAIIDVVVSGGARDEHKEDSAQHLCPHPF